MRPSIFLSHSCKDREQSPPAGLSVAERRLRADRLELDVRRFLDDPWAGTRPDDDPTWSRTYRPPAPGRPVLVLSTLGRGAHPRPELDGAWRRLAAVLAARGSAVAALVPLRRPGAGPVDVVAWDPLTWQRAVARLGVRRADGPA